MSSFEKLSGLVLVDKEEGPTSHHIVNKFRKLLNKIKVGHLGTLDPFASGLLPILLGNTTRLADDLIAEKKTYVFSIFLGQETDTLDVQGRVIETQAVPENYHLKIVEVLDEFRGKIKQVPPVYSALKMNGLPLYQHMRATGKLPQDISTKEKEVTVFDVKILGFFDSDDEHIVTLEVTVSKGFYIRSFARDLARRIGTVGYCKTLRRTKIGDWDVADAVKSQNVHAASDVLERIKLPQTLCDFPFIELCEGISFNLEFGNQATLLRENFIDKSKQTLNDLNSPMKAFLKQAECLFVAEIDKCSDDSFLVKPRKRIQ